MKTVLATRTVPIKEGTTVEVSSRVVTVTGPRGTLKKSFEHIDMDLALVGGGKFVRLDLWFANKKQLASVRTVMSHIINMMTGVTQGFRYKMRFVYSHFPINVAVNGNDVEIRNFLGERRVRKVTVAEGVKAMRSADVKDELVFEGNDITVVSLMAAQVQGATNVRKKDLRKFLDGIYVSEKGAIPEE